MFTLIITLYSILLTSLFIYHTWEPKFELILTKLEQFDEYTLYLYYLSGKNGDEVTKEKKLFTIKRKVK